MLSEIDTFLPGHENNTHLQIKSENGKGGPHWQIKKARQSKNMQSC